MRGVSHMRDLTVVVWRRSLLHSRRSLLPKRFHCQLGTFRYGEEDSADVRVAYLTCKKQRFDIKHRSELGDALFRLELLKVDTPARRVTCHIDYLSIYRENTFLTFASLYRMKPITDADN